MFTKSQTCLLLTKLGASVAKEASSMQGSSFSRTAKLLYLHLRAEHVIAFVIKNPLPFLSFPHENIIASSFK